MDFLEFPDATVEIRGCMNPGRLKLTNSNIIFKNNKTGKIEQVQSSDIAVVNWQRLACSFGLRIFLENGQLHRFGGFKEHDKEKIIKFFSLNYQKQVSDKEFSLKGWNWGSAKFNGSVLSFDILKSTGFEIPLVNVSQCTALKNEVTLEFHQNDEAPVSLMEIRFHVPSETTDAEPAAEFMENVLSKASIIQATGEAIATFTEVHCLTPRGRYDVKLFQSFIQLHGKTFDYKIPMTTILRLFLLPHRDGRQMFFVVSLDPPIKQGQTRYHYLIILFSNEEESTIPLKATSEELEEKYGGKLSEVMQGITYELFSKIMKVLAQRKITVPGNFVGATGTPAVGCSYKAAAGFMYPLERGFIYVHKPPIHVRFEEISCVNFARSGGSTRSFDFEVETKNGVVYIFSSIEKEEYGKLFDFVTGKSLTVKNRGTSNTKDSYKDELVDSDAEDAPDAYLARVKDEAKERMEDGGIGGSSGDESDESFNPGEGSGSDVAEEYDSNPATTSDSEGGAGDGSILEKVPKTEKKKSKSAKTVKEPDMKRKRTKKVHKRDKNQPKRPLSSYFLWLNENRERFKKEHPGISITDLSKKAGEEWKRITDKTEWEKKAAEAKKEYEKAMAEYRLSGAADAAATTDKDGAGDKPVKKSPAKKSSPQKSAPAKQGVFKSKEYISSSSGSSSDEAAKPKPSEKKSAEKKKLDDKKSAKKSEAEDEIDEPVESTPPTSEDESD